MRHYSELRAIMFTVLNIFVLIFSIDQLIHAILDIPALIYMAIVSLFTVETLTSLYRLYHILEEKRMVNHAY